MGLSLVMSFLGIYVVETRGYPAWVYGLIALAGNLGQSLSSAWAGDLSDRIGRMPLITTALFTRTFVIAALGLQVLLDAPLWSLALNMVASSTLRGCFEPVAYALVADVVSDDQRITAFGFQRMMTNVGWAIGPALGGALTLLMPYGAVFFVAATGILIAAIASRRVVDPVGRATGPAKPPGELRAAFREAIRDPLLRLLLAGTFLCALLETQMFSTLAIYMTDEIHLAKADIGLFYTINGLGVLVLQVPALGLIQRIGIARALPWASLIDALGFTIVGLASGFYGGVAAMIALTCAEVVFDPAHQTAIAEISDPVSRGRTYGIVTFAQLVGVAMAPLCGGILLDAIGHRHLAMWSAITTIGLGQTLCFLMFVRRRAAATLEPAPGAG